MIQTLDLLPRYANLSTAKLSCTSDQAADLALFKQRLSPANIARYVNVATAVNLPWILIAALHWRESNGSFSKYLAQGDPLGRPATHVPTNEPVETVWEPAAVDALTTDQQNDAQRVLGLTSNSNDLARMLVYAEVWNGEGYAEMGRPDPYCLAGTSLNGSGKYVADGKFDPNAHDNQIGCLPIFWACRVLDIASS